MPDPPRYVCTDCDREPGALSPCRHALAGSSPNGMRRLYSHETLPPLVLTAEQQAALDRAVATLGELALEACRRGVPAQVGVTSAGGSRGRGAVESGGVGLGLPLVAGLASQG